jgi:hypothetical protein
MEVAFGVNGRFWLDRDRTYHTSSYAILERVMLIDTEFFNNTATTAGVV